MIGRLFNFVLLATLICVIGRALLSPGQRRTLHSLFQTIAMALLASALLISALCLSGFISR